MNAKKNGSGSFCIPKKAIEVLSRPDIDNKVIGAYLVIAMCTARDGVSSSAGIQAIETYLQCGKISAERYVRALVEAGVIIDLRSGLGGEKAMRATVRFKLPFVAPLIDVHLMYPEMFWVVK